MEIIVNFFFRDTILSKCLGMLEAFLIMVGVGRRQKRYVLVFTQVLVKVIIAQFAPAFWREKRREKIQNEDPFHFARPPVKGKKDYQAWYYIRYFMESPIFSNKRLADEWLKPASAWILLCSVQWAVVQNAVPLLHFYSCD